MGQQRRKYTDDYKAGAVERLYEPGATQGSVAKKISVFACGTLKSRSLCHLTLSLVRHSLQKS
ncbi:transposase [Octadecabacter antarcticus]|uniref:transposase n=1 Tax=Octadecabacter antarcticus TaxID=1217908 RepID=UPI0026C76369